MEAYLFSSDHCHENQAASLKVSCAVGLILNQSFRTRNNIARCLEVRRPAWKNTCYNGRELSTKGPSCYMPVIKKNTLGKAVQEGSSAIPHLTS
ncbi:hypothetical protein C0J52_02597 [Blattella germanica]|nr:hypothetical protein C0J52_02597 [Blattella germanica]